MSDAAVAPSAAPFESASELREAHARLLDAFDSQLGEDASSAGEAAALARLEPEIRLFLERGAATGIYLEEMKERTSCQVLLDYWLSSLAQAGLQAGSARLARFDAEQLPDLKEVRCPYVGLDAFQDRTYFFGRETDTKALLAQVRDAPLVVVLGASGSGKSSLVMGGVLPALTAEGTLRVVPPFVPGNAQSVLSLVGAEAPPALITIDQFEEVFTLSSEEDREALVASLARLLEAGHRVILTMREEFRSRIVELRALSPYLDKAWYSMRPMDYDELRAAVEKPAALVNLQFQAGIVDDLVKKVLGQPAALPLLQFTLRLLWKERDRNRITWEVYDKIGDPLNALKASADQFYDGLAPQTQIEVRRVLLELVRVDELLEAYRQPVPMSRLLQAGKANTEEVIKLLAENDYVRITAGAPAADAVVEVKHESLVRNWPRFVGWIDDKRRELRQRLALTQAARRWAESGKPAEGLLTGWQLEEAKGHSNLSAVEEELVQASAKAVERAQQEREDVLRREVEQELEQQRNRRNAALVGAGALVVIVLMVLAGWLELEASRARARATRLATEAETQKRRANEATKRVIAQQKVSDSAISEAITAKIRATELEDLAAEEAAKAHQEQERATALGREAEDQKRKAAELLREAESTRLMANADRLQAADYDTSLLVNVEAASVAPPLEMSAGLLRRFVSHPDLSAFLPGHKNTVRSVAFSPDGKRLASASWDHTIILWDVDGRQPLATLTGHKDQVFSVAFSPDGKRLASASQDHTVILWDADSHQPLATLAGHKEGVWGVAFSPDGKRLASAGWDHAVILWDVDSRQPLATLVEHKDAVLSVAFSPDGKRLASASQDQTVILWDVDSHQALATLEGRQGSVASVAFSPDGKRLAAANWNQTVSLWDLDSRQPLATLAGHKGPVFSVAFSPDGKRLASASLDNTVILWGDYDSRRSLVRLGGHRNLVNSIAFSPDGKRLASASTDGIVVLWEVDSRRPLAPLAWDKNPVFSIAFSPDGKWLAAASTDGIVLWEVDSRKPLAPLVGHEGWVSSVAFSPDGKRLASASSDKTVILWDVDSHRPLTTLTGHKDGVAGVAFSPDGKRLASASWDKTVILWDLASRKPLATLEGHKDAVWGVAFSPDGKRLASASADQTVTLWDLDSRRPLALGGHRGTVSSVAFSPDGKRLASASWDQTVILWDLDLGILEAEACRTANRNLTCGEWRNYIGADKPYHKTCPALPGPEKCK